LFCTNKALKNGYDPSNKDLLIFLSKGYALVTFDGVMSTTNSSVSGIQLLVNESRVVYNILISPCFGKKVDINEFHKILGYCGSYRLEKTAKIHDLKLNGEFKTCEQCAIAKAKQKSFKKDWKGRTQVSGEQL
jgi:hypothetical protein